MTELVAKDLMTKDVIFIEPPSSREDVLKILKRTGLSGIPVVNGKDRKLLGIITRKDILRKSDESQVALLMSKNLITIKPNTKISEAVKLLTEKKIRRLIVEENNTLVGILSISDIIGVVAKSNDTREIREGFLTQNTLSTWEETPLSVVGRIMELGKIDALPILNSDNILTGIISERDLIRLSHIEDTVQTSDFSVGTDDDEWTWESYRDNHTISYAVSKVELPMTPVKEGMIKKVLAVPKNAEVSECALKMKRARIDQMPVIDPDGKLCGMLFDRVLIQSLLNK